MISTAEKILVDTKKIVCDGDKDSPHPRVFLTTGKEGHVDCPYCGKHYVLKEGAASDHGH